MSFIEGKLYRVSYAEEPAFSRYRQVGIVVCRANAFIFLKKADDLPYNYLFYAASECAVVTIDTVWATRNIVEMK